MASIGAEQHHYIIIVTFREEYANYIYNRSLGDWRWREGGQWIKEGEQLITLPARQKRKER